MTVDELLQMHPLPWTIVSFATFGTSDYVHDANGIVVCDFDRGPIAFDVKLFAEVMSELVRLRESSMVQTHERMAAKLETAEEEIVTLRAFRDRVKDAPARLVDAVYALEGDMREQDSDAVRAIAAAFADRHFDEAIFGECGVP